MLPIGLCTCGRVTSRTTVAEVSDGTSFEAHQCATCFDQQQAELDHIERQYLFLVDNGVSPDRASEIMSKRIAEAAMRCYG